MTFRNMERSLPRIGITLGDPGGVGPEVVFKSLPLLPKRAALPIALFGSRRVLSLPLIQRLRAPLPARIISAGQPLGSDPLTFVDCPPDHPIALGVSHPDNGRAAHTCLTEAVSRALAGEIQALVTAP